jgi:ubiquinone/menaquinone biosynthesis C-methylase UbiE
LRASYDRDAHRYDEKHRHLQWPKYEATVPRLRLRGAMALLDLGTGTGLLAEYLGRGLVGIDLSYRILLRARGRGVRVLQGDIEFLPFRDRSFDVAFCYTSLFRFPQVDGTLREVNRILRPSGNFVVTILKIRFYEDFPRQLWHCNLIPGPRIDCGQDWGYVCEKSEDF